MAVFYLGHWLFTFPFVNEAINPVGIAMFHSIFNICTTALLLPFTKQLVKLAEGTIKTEPEREVAFLDERLLKTPSVALQECTNITVEMAHLAKKSMFGAMDILFNYDEKQDQLIRDMEGDIDIYEDHLGSYLVKLSGTNLSDSDSRQISKLLHTIGNFERISDHAVNIVGCAKEISDKDIRLSDEGLREIGIATDDIKEIMNISIDRNLRTPLFWQIFDQIKELIINGSLPDGSALPSERTQARILGVHRNTIIKAYSLLKDADLIDSVQGVGYVVTYREETAEAKDGKETGSGRSKKRGSGMVNWATLIKDEYQDMSTMTVPLA